MKDVIYMKDMPYKLVYVTYIYHSANNDSGRCPKLKKYRLVLPAASTVIPQFSKSFSKAFVHVSFIKLRLYTKERIRNRMPFTTCRNSKYSVFMVLRILAEMG